MTAKSTIIQEITASVRKTNTSFSSWRIGLTHDPADRKTYWKEIKNIGCWTQWTPESLADAQDIESHFINEKGMKGGTGGDLSASYTVYVYIF